MFSRLRRYLAAIAIALIAVTVLVTPVMAYLYRAPLTILEGSGIAYTDLPVLVSANNKYMASEGYMASDARDTRVATAGGTAVPHMVSDSMTLAAVDVPASGQVNLYFLTGETSADMDIIVGRGGYLTVADAAAMEPGNNFSFEYNGYVDTSVTGSLLSKTDALTITVGGGAITTWIPPTVSDTVQYSSDSEVNTASSSYTLVKELTIAMTVPEARVKFDLRSGTAGYTSYGRVYKNGVAVGTERSTTSNSYTTYSEDIVVNCVAGDKIQLYAKNASAQYTYVRNFRVCFTYMSPVSSAVTSGDHTIVVAANGTNLTLAVDGTTLATGALSGVSVPNNSNNWVLMSNATPYAHYIKHTVNGSLVAYYAPNDIVHGRAYSTGTVTVTNGSASVVGSGTSWTSYDVGAIFVSADGVWYTVSSVTDATHLTLTTTYGGGTLSGQSYALYPKLVDRQGDDNPAELTLGSNPVGVTATLGGLVPGSQAEPGISDVDDTPTDSLDEIESSDWFTEPDVSTKLQNNPLRPFVLLWSDNSSVTEDQAWVFLGLVFVVMVTAGVGAMVRGHHVITGFACAAAIGVCVTMTIWPLWALVFIIPAIFGGMIAEKTPSL